MRRTSVLTIALLVLSVASACMRPARLTRTLERDQLYSRLVGEWQGTLETPDSLLGVRVTRHTKLKVVPAPDRDGLELQFQYEDAQGRVATRTDRLHFDGAMETARWGNSSARWHQAFDVISRGGGEGAAPLRLVLQTTEEADSLGLDVPGNRQRETFVVSAGEVRMVTEEQVDEDTFAFRHAYVLRRAE
ncbi:MAG TPA: hypothetical protein VGE27_18135 [Gemmatimonas sp.]|uniref:hypothetical protein n=1 Tax=Gemmatimonas sp. TaxID=1962908 RepID=UPI002EDADC54